jgi:UDP-N-acetylglucosamine acyltransferase
MQDLYNNDWINIDGNSIHKTAIVHPNVKLGKGNTIGAYAVIGSNGEIRGVNQNDFRGTVEIGDNNVISEFVSIQRPFKEGERTYIGNNNIIMAHSHIGHDVEIFHNCEICSGTIIGGYVIIHSGAKLKLGVTVRNRIEIGLNVVVGLGSVVTKDILEGVAYGNPARVK